MHVEPRSDGLDLRDRVLAAALAERLVREAHDIAIYENGDRCSVSLHLKFPPEVSLVQAHEVADRVERAIAGEPRVDAVQTHLESLEPFAVRVEDRRDAREHERIRNLVSDATGREPGELRLLHADAGLVVFLSVKHRCGGDAGPGARRRRSPGGRGPARERHHRRRRGPHRTVTPAGGG